MSKIETQLEINGVTYSGKDLNLILLGMSLKEERIIKLLEGLSTKCSCDIDCHREKEISPSDFIALIKGEK